MVLGARYLPVRSWGVNGSQYWRTNYFSYDSEDTVAFSSYYYCYCRLVSSSTNSTNIEIPNIIWGHDSKKTELGKDPPDIHQVPRNILREI
jgi:hypothetical protein